MAVIRTQRGLDRLVNFSDATVAIAITLLILPLVDASPEIVEDGIGPYFQENLWRLLAFAVSFVVVARFWMVHHQVFEWIESYNTKLLWLNVLWLASIVFIPFTANILSVRADADPATNALYVGNLLLTTLSMQLIEILVTRTPELTKGEARQNIDSLNGWAFVVLMVIALALVILFPRAGMLWLLVLFFSRPVYLGLRALTRRR